MIILIYKKMSNMDFFFKILFKKLNLKEYFLLKIIIKD
jgi:hypothetical protein